MTLPRVFSLSTDDGLAMEAAPEVASLRFDHIRVTPREIPANEEVVLEEIGGKAIEIEATIEPGAAREVGLCVFRATDLAELTRISWFTLNERRPDIPKRFYSSSLQIDVSAASLGGDVYARTPEIGPLDLEEGEPLRLNVFVDRSIVEVFANGRQCLTVRAYPEREDSLGVSVFARGGAARLASLDAWQMRSVWPELTDREGG